MRSPNTLLLVAVLCLLNYRCTGTDFVGSGGSSETVNAQLSVSDSTLQVQVEDSKESYSLQVFSPDYRPDYRSGYTATAEQNGSKPLQWTAPHSGRFNILIHNEFMSRACFVTGLSVKNDTTYTVTCSIAPTRSLQGVLAKRDSTLADEQYAITVIGSPFFTTSDKQSDFILEHIPYSTVTLNIRPVENKLFSPTVQYQLTASVLKTVGNVRLVLP